MGSNKNSSVKAVTLQGTRALALQEFPYPDIEAGAVLLRIGFSGICGTDKHAFKGRTEQKGGQAIPLPIIPGHETVGTVAELGGEVLDHNGVPLNVGDRVVIAPNLPCGRCYACRNNLPYYYCREKRDYGNNIGAGDPPHLFGGWSEYLYALPGSHLFRYPETLPLEYGTFVEPLTVTACLDKARQWSSEWEPFRTGDTVVILGVGPIGIVHVAKARILGAGRVVAVDLSAFRLSVAAKFGASDTILGGSVGDVQQQVEQLTGGRGADVVVDCTGVPEGLIQSLELIREGGMVLEVGIFSDDGTVPLNPHRHILEKSARLIGVGGDELSAYDSSIRILEATKDTIPWHEAITHKFALEEADQAMETALGPESMKVVFAPA